MNLRDLFIAAALILPALGCSNEADHTGPAVPPPSTSLQTTSAIAANPQPTSNIPEDTETRVHWHEIFELDIRDPELKSHAEGVLDALERWEPDPSKQPTGLFSGQDLLHNIEAIKSAYNQNSLAQNLISQGIMLNGKFVIGQDDRLFDGGPDTSPHTQNIEGAERPIRIILTPDFLKGAKYPGTDMRIHPVTIDEVLMHEITHFALMTEDEQPCINQENAFKISMGGVPAISNLEKFDFVRDGNGGYATLYNKVPVTPVPGVQPPSL